MSDHIVFLNDRDTFSGTHGASIVVDSDGTLNAYALDCFARQSHTATLGERANRRRHERYQWARG